MIDENRQLSKKYSRASGNERPPGRRHGASDLRVRREMRSVERSRLRIFCRVPRLAIGVGRWRARALRLGG